MLTTEWEWPSKPVDIRDGVVYTEAVEVNAVWHCNIRCRWCSHASPAIAGRSTDVEATVTALRRLARWLRCDHLRFVGGEPLLNPQLPELMGAARATGICDRVRVLTNGLTLHEMDTTFWDVADEVHVSVYPNTRKAVERRIEHHRRAARLSRTVLILKYFDHFRVSYRAPDARRDLADRIYRTCQIGNVWRCLTIEDGRLYRCPQATYLDQLTADTVPRVSGADGVDFLNIADITSVNEVEAWMLRKDSLRSCAACTGSVGVRRPHQQLRRGDDPVVAGEVDYQYLAALETDPDVDNGCVTRSVVLCDG